MNKLEYMDVLRAIDTVKENETILNKRYLELNPTETERRNKELELINYALMRVEFEIKRRFEGGLK